MSGYSKIITTVNSISPGHTFSANSNNCIVIDTSENRIGINTIAPEESIHVNDGTIKTKDLIVLGDLSADTVGSGLIPKTDLLRSLGDIDHMWKDIHVGPGTIYMDKTPIIYMGDYTRNGHNDISALVIENGLLGSLKISSDLTITSDVSINKSITATGGLILMGDNNVLDYYDAEAGGSQTAMDASSLYHVDITGELRTSNDLFFMNKLSVNNDTSFNKDVDISGVLNITKSTGSSIVSTKMYTKKQPGSNGVTQFIIDPSTNGSGDIVIKGSLDVKGTTTFINFRNVDISDNIIRVNANHTAAPVNDGGISVTNSSTVDKLFSYNNPGDHWKTHNTDIELGQQGGVVSSAFVNAGHINIDGSTINSNSGNLMLNTEAGDIEMSASLQTNISSSQETVINSQLGEVVIESITISGNNISTAGGSNLNINGAGNGNISTQDASLNLGSGTLSVDGVSLAHMPKGGITLWYGSSSNTPVGWAICDGNNGTPNLLGRFVVGSGNNGETNYIAGSSGGNDTYTLDISHIPSHNHAATSQNTDVPHEHHAACAFKDIPHNHGATCEDTDVLHNHDASFQNTDIIHNHAATSQNTDVLHSHTASLVLSQDTNLNHTHGAATEQVTSTHTHNANNQTDLGSWTGHVTETHGHIVTLDESAHNHIMDISGLGDNHQHSISSSDAPHGHGLSFEFSYSNTGGAAGTRSLLLDDQDEGDIQASQLSGGFTGGAQTANAPHDHTTETVDSTHPFYGQTEHTHTLDSTTHTHTTVVSTATDTSHTHTTQVTPGGVAHDHTYITTASSILHSHEVAPTLQASINHNHVIQTQQTSINHNHVVGTEQTSINHNHVIQLANENINHKHIIELENKSIDHNHLIGTAHTGGGVGFDNRPKWFGLWYIMKL